MPEVPAEIQRRFRFELMMWPSFFAIGILHLACVFAPFTFTWSGVVVMIVLYGISGLGVSMGYHRLLTHRGFETSSWFRYLLTIFGTLNFQGGPLYWVGTHRIHHKDSDTDMDPHSPKHGFAWAHMLWCLIRDPFGRDVYAAAKDLQKEPGMVFLEKFFWVPQVALAGLLYWGGGWSWVIWGVAVRTVLTYHATWLVNSASHLWGYKNFETTDDSRNNWFVALVAWGEGWHNNHHAHQRSARHGLRWYEIDFTYIMLRIFEFFGLVKNIYVVDAPTGPRI